MQSYPQRIATMIAAIIPTKGILSSSPLSMSREEAEKTAKPVINSLNMNAEFVRLWSLLEMARLALELASSRIQFIALFRGLLSRRKILVDMWPHPRWLGHLYFIGL
jgi:hypothetical protein